MQIMMHIANYFLFSEAILCLAYTYNNALLVLAKNDNATLSIRGDYRHRQHLPETGKNWTCPSCTIGLRMSNILPYSKDN